jgi:hypothetical protein
LLAKNGTIGAPPVGGRRRRRRASSDSVTVAELTGEIPIVTGDTDADVRDNTADPATDELDEVRDDFAGPLPGRDDFAGPLPGRDDFAGPLPGRGVAEHVEERDVEPLFAEPPPDRPLWGHTVRRYPVGSGSGAEGMSPDPVDVGDDADALPSYLRPSAGPPLGGEAVADRRGGGARLDDFEFGDVDMEHDEDEEDLDVELEHDEDEESTMSSFARGGLVVGQSIGAVLFGGGLFIAFDQLWKWNNIVALALSVLVILGLVVGVRVVRKTEDIGSTLIAVAVGALVTLGPLALLQSG